MRGHVALFACLLGAGCTTFSTVRSARVERGLSAAVHASASTNPGNEAGWFWAYDCAEQCGEPVVGADLGVTYGWPGREGRTPLALGAGMSGVYPYVEGYAQLGEGARPFGLGARIGVPLTGWTQHQAYARLDLPLAARTRLLLNPALLVHHGASPNGRSRGTFVAFVQGAGVLLEGERVSLTPAVALVLGSARRDRWGERSGPEATAFATASLGLTFHRRRAR